MNITHRDVCALGAAMNFVAVGLQVSSAGWILPLLHVGLGMYCLSLAMQRTEDK